jgi:NAD(P)-dependent dehydrogenase (short-subunit alcohol dehydrogenase family)
VIDLVDKLYSSTKSGKEKDFGFTAPTYSVTKALLNAYTRWVLVTMLKDEQQCFTACPGWCKTDMGGISAMRSAEKGAETPAFLINLDWKKNEKLNGCFIYDKKVIKF